MKLLKKVTVCPECNSEVISTEDYVSKQVVDIEINLIIREERAYTGVCSKCGRVHEGTFLEEFINPVQYGNNMKTIVSLLNDYAYVPNK